MRILQISSAKTFGASERHFVDLCRELTARGHDVFVALRPTNEWSARLDFIPADNFLHTSIRNSFGMFSAPSLADFAAKNMIDILHAHVARDYLAASIACRSAKGVRLVLTRHLLSSMKSFHRFALRNVDTAIAISAAGRPHLARIFPTEKIYFVPPGIAVLERDPYAVQTSGIEFRAFHGIGPQAPLVVMLGELKLAKGQRDFVLAANEIVKRFPDCRFIIAGLDNSMDKKFRRELRRLSRVLDLDENILWLGWLDDIDPLLDAADIFVSPSHDASFGRSILAAMAAGCACVAAETAVSRELLQNYDLLTPVKDPLTLAMRICNLLGDKPKRGEIIEQLHASVRENYGIEKMADATEAVYLKVLSY